MIVDLKLCNRTVNTYSNFSQSIKVSNAQIEIDAGFESHNSIVIIEAKNVVHKDFHIRQLYYPYRLWKNKVSKPIRLVFSLYSNKIFRLMEYQFADEEDFSSIKLIKTKNYSLEDTNITLEDLKNVFNKTKVRTDDNKKYTNVPFVQANNFERVISMMEQMYIQDMSREDIQVLMQFVDRQIDYHFNAGRYLGIFKKKSKQIDGVKKIYYELTTSGKKLMKLNYKERQLNLVSLMFEHQIFRDLFEITNSTGVLPSAAEIEQIMLNYNVCNKSTTSYRRASSVLGWIKWLYNLINL